MATKERAPERIGGSRHYAPGGQSGQYGGRSGSSDLIPPPFLPIASSRVRSNR